MKPKIICVFNSKEIFEKVVKNNENIQNCEIFSFDNTIENISITKRYNSFIEEHIGRGAKGAAPSETKDFWYFFIHQDFGINEDIELITEKLNKNYIYGPIGVKMFRGLFFGKKDKEGHFGFKNHFVLTLGRISQGDNDFNFKPHGRKVLYQPTVDAIDCCCIIIHSSLIQKYNLRFDENLNFHMYAEELCYRAKKEFKIKTKVVQMNCFHLGKGSLDENFDASVKYLKEKFKIKRVPSTCIN